MTSPPPPMPPCPQHLSQCGHTTLSTYTIWYVPTSTTVPAVNKCRCRTRSTSKEWCISMYKSTDSYSGRRLIHPSDQCDYPSGSQHYLMLVPRNTQSRSNMQYPSLVFALPQEPPLAQNPLKLHPFTYEEQPLHPTHSLEQQR